MLHLPQLRATFSLKFCSVVGVFLVLGFFNVRNASGFKIGDNPYHRGAFLDSRERYRLEWQVNHLTITFNVTVQTRGWILFGLANDAGNRTGRDVVIGGVDQSGEAYFMDAHTGRYNERLQKDIIPDYTLHDSWESGTHTFLSFSRNLDTCDHQDYPITENRVTLIWGYGNEDKENGPGGSGRNSYEDQGSYDVYLMDPEYAPRITHFNLFDERPRITGSDAPLTQTWTIQRRIQLPANDTAYLCSIHKAPRLTKKHHVMGFDVRFEDDLSRRHVHHLIVHKCRAPAGVSPNSLFESGAQSGELASCLSVLRPTSGNVPVHFCSQIYMVWALGGRAFFVPDNVGMPFGESPEEYYMAQVHYDNPTMRTDVRVGINVDFFYTPRLRPNDGGFLGMGHDVPGVPEATVIPPRTSNIRMFGHCGGECTSRILPEEGFTLVSAFLHSHTSGKQLRLHHFRRNEELPWILYDDNYSNEFQQIRALPRGEVQIYPGDQLTMDCTYDTTWTNSTVIGGYRTRQEMCLAYLFYYNLQTDYSFCRSEIVSPAYRQRFLGVTNVTWYESEIDWVAMPPTPSFLVGRTITDISDNEIEWDEEARKDLRNFREQHPHVEKCGRDLFNRDPAEIQRVLQSAPDNGEGLVISGDTPTSVNTEYDYSGPAQYPQGVIPYDIPTTRVRCLPRGYFDKRTN